jgi:hypothetical protein
VATALAWELRDHMRRGIWMAAIALILAGCGTTPPVEVTEASTPPAAPPADSAEALAGADSAMAGCVVSESGTPAITADHPQTLRAAARDLRDGADYQSVRRIDRTHALVRQRDGDELTVFVVERSDFGWFAYTALIGPADCPEMQAEFERAADPSFRPTDG